MPLMPGFKRFFRRFDRDMEREVERDVDDELQFHIDMKARDLEAGDLVAGGVDAEAMSPAAAQAGAMSRFGDLEEIRSQCLVIQSLVSKRRSRGGLLDGFRQNLRVAYRTLRRRPGFAAAAVLTLAIAIGANSAMFSVIKTVVLGPLPFEVPGQIVQLWDAPPGNGEAQQISLPNLRDYRNRSDAFSHLAAIHSVNLFGEEGGNFEFVAAQYISADLFDMMGVVPTAGRTFNPAEDTSA